MMRRDDGFTLVEVLIAILISSFVIYAIYSVYDTQQRSYVIQEEVAQMQQNVRAGMHFISRDIRSAGYDPTGDAGAGIVVANADTINMTMDLTEDGDVTDVTANEDITYALAGTNLTRDRNDGSGAVTIAENIDALDFVYLDGSSPPVVLNPGGGNVPAGNLTLIETIEVTMVVHSDRKDWNYTNDEVYTNQQGTTILDMSGAPDHLRRRRLTTAIQCRNLGL
jgi:type IV pilus assembly protein PilW